jgi:hypothetical protein
MEEADVLTATKRRIILTATKLREMPTRRTREGRLKYLECVCVVLLVRLIKDIKLVLIAGLRTEYISKRIRAMFQEVKGFLMGYVINAVVILTDN